VSDARHRRLEAKVPKFPTLNRHARRKAMSKQTPREVERIFELTFADIGSRLDLNEA
jgi:hypothetical protein